MNPTAGSLAVITGPTAGIGRVFADRLARRGHPLLLISRDAARLAALARELATAHGVTARTVPADLSSEAEIERVAALLEHEPNIGVLVNNAGFGTKGKLQSTPIEPQMHMLHLHVVAPMRLARAVLPGMTARHSGWVINVSSIASFLFSAGNANYCATKAYLTSFSKSLDAEVREDGVVVQALCPGFTHTEFHARMHVDKTQTPSLLWLTAEHVVDASIAAAARGGPVVVVPSWRYRIIRRALAIVPDAVVRWKRKR